MAKTRRKHRLVVDFTTSNSLTEKEASSALAELLERLDLGARPIVIITSSTYAVKLHVSRFSKVLQSEMNKRRKPGR